MAVTVRAVSRVVGLNIGTCILCVRDLDAFLDHHMICCAQGEIGCVVTDSISKLEITKSR